MRENEKNDLIQIGGFGVIFRKVIFIYRFEG